MNARLSEGQAKRFGFIWDYVFRGDEMWSWTCPACTDGFRLGSQADMVRSSTGLSTGGVAPATHLPDGG